VKWHIFSGRETEVPAPDFCLMSSAGDTLCDFAYRQRLKQVLVFPAGSDRADWTPVLEAFSQHTEALEREGTAVLALLPAGAEDIRGYGADLAYSYPILADPGAQVRRAYEERLQGDTGDSHMVFVLDPFGAPYAAVINANPADPALFDQISQWVTFIAIQCPE
jgi:peroxiredoxin